LQQHPEKVQTLRAVAVVEGDLPVGLIGRQRFVDRDARPYFRELYGRRSCMLFAKCSPRLVDVQHGIEELSDVLRSDDQRDLSEGIIITENGRYLGLASGEDLVRSVTEARIEAARHANPLSLLPGNIPLTQHIQRLLASGREFVACYGDLNHFKPFNDLYGYWRGDEMILCAARAFTEGADALRDFVGHVGGDDFVVLFQSDDWDERCLAVIARFNAAAIALYDATAVAAGGVMAEDRHGVRRLHPLTTLTTLSIGAVRVHANDLRRAEDVANDAARAKREAKAKSVGLFVLDAALP
jgi:diguanylate cyclase (GGDEF)-like protein